MTQIGDEAKILAKLVKKMSQSLEHIYETCKVGLKRIHQTSRDVTRL